MKRFVLVLTAFILLLLQLTVTWRFKLGWHNYGLLLAAVIVLGGFDSAACYISAAICGFSADCLLGGGHLLTCLAAAFVMHLLSKMVYKRSLPIALLMTFLITFVSELLHFFIDGSGEIAFALTKLIFPQAFINVLCAAVIYGIYKALWKVLKLNRKGWER